jgi:hypothetical protein
MDHDQLKAAFHKGVPVEVRGIQYKYISALIYRRLDGNLHVQAELMDKNERSVVIVLPKWINEINEAEKGGMELEDQKCSANL